MIDGPIVHLIGFLLLHIVDTRKTLDGCVDHNFVHLNTGIVTFVQLTQPDFRAVFIKMVYRGPGIMMPSSNGNIFRVTGPLCGEFIGHR